MSSVLKLSDEIRFVNEMTQNNKTEMEKMMKEFKKENKAETQLFKDESNK